MDLIVPICTAQLNNVQNIKVTQFDSIVEHRTLGTGTLKYRSNVRSCHSCNNDCCVLLFFYVSRKKILLIIFMQIRMHFTLVTRKSPYNC
jgi:hypothetical protein